MEDSDYFILARALHVIGVVIWIGGVAFVTTVLIPALKKMTDARNRLELFEQLEGKFGFQAKIASLITGVSGYYMLDVMNAWKRYQQLEYFRLCRSTHSYHVIPSSSYPPVPVSGDDVCAA